MSVLHYQFQVGVSDLASEELEEETREDEQEQTNQNPGPLKILTSSSSEEILSCPSCEQRLKVPMDRRPVMSRCPACRAEFMALNEGVPG